MADESIYLIDGVQQGDNALLAGRGKLLGQLRPSNLTAVTLYTVPTDIKIFFNRIFITNVENAARTYRLFYDEAGATYDEDTALAWDITLNKGMFIDIPLQFISCTPGATFGVRTDNANALNFSLFGTEFIDA